MEKKNSDKKNKLKIYSKIYKKSKVSQNTFVKVMKYIFVFFLVALVGYFCCVITYSFLNREHVTEVNVSENYGQNSNIMQQKQTKKEDEITKNKYEQIVAKDFGCNFKVDFWKKKFLDRLDEFIKKNNNKYNAVVIKLKEDNGFLHYKSETELAKEWKTFTNKADDIEKVREYCKIVKERGLVPIASISAFLDGAAPSVSRENSFLKNLSGKNVKQEVHVFEEPYIKFKNQKGPVITKKGKWLNPLCDKSRKYIIDLVKELKELGFSYILIDNVRFPNVCVELELDDGSVLDKSAVLKNFIGELKATGANFIISYNIESLIDEEMKANCFGGDISKYGITHQAPIVGMSFELNSNLGEYENMLKNLRKEQPNTDIIPFLSLVRHSDCNKLRPKLQEIVENLTEFDIDSYINFMY